MEAAIRLRLAYRLRIPDFVWNSEAIDQAHVHVVIIGFSRSSGIKKILFIGDELHPARNINGYLQDAPNFFIARRSQPLCDVEPMVRGCQPTDGGNLVFSTKEADEACSPRPKNL